MPFSSILYFNLGGCMCYFYENKKKLPRGWDRESGGREVQEGGNRDICVPMADSS